MPRSLWGEIISECVCVRARVRARAHARVRACVYVRLKRLLTSF